MTLQRRLSPFLRTLLLAAALAAAAHPASAWGPVGHRVVGGIADPLLSPAAQAAVADLLADDRDRDGAPSGRRTLADVADWADEIRGTPADRPHWHFDNEPVCARAPDPGAGSSRWCAQGQCASAQLQSALAVLADRRRTHAERNAALKWAVHLVGDLHQPLHAADLAEGGNRIRVAPYERNRRKHPPAGNGRGESLHAFWDTRLVAIALHTRQGDVAPRTLSRLVRAAQGEDPALVAAPPAQWVAESNRIARDFALRLDGVSCERERPGDTPPVSLPDDYVGHARTIVVERLALAGARLAYVLNQALAPRP
jgi:hypothetical protein